MTPYLRRSHWVLALLIAVTASHSVAGPIASLVVFGDSLSDTGNVLQRTNEASLFTTPRPTTPWYDTGRWTNGTSNDGSNTTAPRTKETAYGGVWHERLADKLKIPRASHSLGGGANWAFGGAVTGMGTFTSLSFPNIRTQITQYLATNPIFNDKQLFAIWGGGNDVRDAANLNGATEDSIKAAGATALDNLKAGIQALATAGAKNFVWPNLPPLQRTPEALAITDQGRLLGLHDASEEFRDNQKTVADGLMQQFPGISICVLNVFDTFEDIAFNRVNYGYTETTRGVVAASDFSARTFTVSANFPNDQVDADKFLFWDQVHPTARTHDLVGMQAFMKLRAMIPEPTAFAIAFQIAALFLVRRQAAARSRAWSDRTRQ
jgi:outer membrane lipase/esterase